MSHLLFVHHGLECHDWFLDKEVDSRDLCHVFTGTTEEHHHKKLNVRV